MDLLRDVREPALGVTRIFLAAIRSAEGQAGGGMRFQAAQVQRESEPLVRFTRGGQRGGVVPRAGYHDERTGGRGLANHVRGLVLRMGGHGEAAKSQRGEEARGRPA